MRFEKKILQNILNQDILASLVFSHEKSTSLDFKTRNKLCCRMAQTKAQRSIAAKKAARTRKQNAAAKKGSKSRKRKR